MEKTLTPRERDVLRCLMDGNSTKDIAVELGIGFETASCHLKAIYRKLGIFSARQLLQRDRYVAARMLLRESDISNVDSSQRVEETQGELRTQQETI